MDDRIHDDQAAMQHQGGRMQGMRQGSGGNSRSTSPASTQMMDWESNDAVVHGGGGHVDPGAPDLHAQNENRYVGLPDDEPAEEPVLRAWYNLVAGVGEIVGPSVRVVLRDPHAFLTCMMMTGLFAQQGLGASSLAGYMGDEQETGGDPAVSAMSEAGRVVSVVYNMQTGAGVVCHPRGRLDVGDPNDLWVQITYRIVGPAVRLAREMDGWRLTRDGMPVGQELHGAEPWGQEDWPPEGDDQEAVDFLLTQHMIAADDELEEDTEATAFISSHQTFAAVPTASMRQVTVLRDGAGMLQEIRANDRSRHQMNYSTLNQDDNDGRWAAVEPFSAAGARATLDAILLPSLWSQRRPVRLEIAPMRSSRPGMLTMQDGIVFNPWSAEGLRAAFRLIQTVARGRYARVGSSSSPWDIGLSQPAVTIVVTIGRD